MKTKFVYMLIGIFVFTGQLKSQTIIRIGDEFQLQGSPDRHQYVSSVSRLKEGSYIVPITSTGNEYADLDAKAQRYDENNNPIGPLFLVNTHTEEKQRAPIVCALNNGGFAIAWESWAQEPTYGRFGIFTQCYDENADPQGMETQVNTFTHDNQKNICMTTLTTGNYVIIWMSFNQDGFYGGIYGQMFNEDGTKIGGEFQCHEYTDNGQINPSAASLNDGKFVVAWSSFGQDGSKGGIYARMFDQNAAPLGNEFRINSIKYGWQSHPDVASFSDGSFIITWYSDCDFLYPLYETAYPHTLYAQRYNSQGSKIGYNIKIERPVLTGAKCYAEIDVLSNDMFVITWAAIPYFKDNFYDKNIYCKVYKKNGWPIGNKIQINSNINSDCLNPQVSALDNEKFMIFWHSNDSSDDYSRVWGQQLQVQ